MGGAVEVVVGGCVVGAGGGRVVVVAGASVVGTELVALVEDRSVFRSNSVNRGVQADLLS
jgi:hypothetical protein